MSKKNIGIIIISIIVILGIGFFNLYRTGVMRQEKAINIKKVVLKDNSKIIERESKVYTNANDFKRSFNVTEGLDFQNYNYVLIPIQYDSCSEHNIEIADYQIKGDKIKVYVEYEASCGYCAALWEYYVIKVDKEMTKADVDIDYRATNNPHCNPDVAYKPMIYLYPEEKKEVTVELGNKQFLTTTYPKYEDSWQVTVYPDGTLVDENERIYYGLYWEGNNHKAKIKEEGFVVKGKDSISFLEEKLSILGLTEKEANEFIVYWLPKMEKNPYNYIYFETREEIEEYMPLTVTPTPDTTIRILMNIKSLEKPIKVKEQNLSTIERKGFTVVEWGGSII